MVSLQANWLGPSVSNMARMAVYRKRVGLYRVTVSFPAWPIASARGVDLDRHVECGAMLGRCRDSVVDETART